jgi:hypothetical protein
MLAKDKVERELQSEIGRMNVGKAEKRKLNQENGKLRQSLRQKDRDIQ